MCKAAKKKDKAGEAAEGEKPKPVAFGCEELISKGKMLLSKLR